MLEKLVESSGDDIVEGIVRYRKVKECKGYKEAKKKACFRISGITGGRILETGGYAAVISYRWIFIVIPLVILLLLLGLFYSISTRGREQQQVETEYYIEPESTIYIAGENNKDVLYIDIPGFSDIEMTSDNHMLSFYNPSENECVLQYYIYVQDILVKTTDYIAQGEEELVDIYEMLGKGIHRMKIITKGFSEDKETEYNSVLQEIELTVI